MILKGIIESSFANHTGLIMADKSTIEWTDATWNPVTGCTKISVGCDNCYASRFSERFRGVAGHPFENGFDLSLRSERLLQPFDWKRPRMIFVNSMSDLFHKEVPKDYISKPVAEEIITDIFRKYRQRTMDESR
jgi:protein gp37